MVAKLNSDCQSFFDGTIFETTSLNIWNCMPCLHGCAVPGCAIECRRRQNDHGAHWTLCLEIPAISSCPSASRQSPGTDDSTQPGNGTVAAADTLAVINLYVSRVRSSMSWIKTPADVIGRHAVYDCNSLVCAVGRRVAADGGVMPGFHHSIAVLLLPFRRSRYANSARIT